VQEAGAARVKVRSWPLVQPVSAARLSRTTQALPSQPSKVKVRGLSLLAKEARAQMPYWRTVCTDAKATCSQRGKPLELTIHSVDGLPSKAFAAVPLSAE